ncbi:MAG: hypothetical protein GWO02_01960, partial [Gammaproteobacteria bacterium]|nr:hypothetical protein [Gammaproteobacteria bacterium]
AMGQGTAAAALVGELVWGDTQDTAMVHERSERLMRWRGLLAEAYLLAGRVGD